MLLVLVMITSSAGTMVLTFPDIFQIDWGHLWRPFNIWHHDMKMVLTLLALCEGTRGFSSSSTVLTTLIRLKISVMKKFYYRALVTPLPDPHLCTVWYWHLKGQDGYSQWLMRHTDPDSKVQGANMGPIWVLSAPDGPHVGPMNLAIWERTGNWHSANSHSWWQSLLISRNGSYLHMGPFTNID